jgi:hypothetical protein
VHDHVGHAAEDGSDATQPAGADQHQVRCHFLGELRQLESLAALDAPEECFGVPSSGSCERDADVGDAANDS